MHFSILSPDIIQLISIYYSWLQLIVHMRQYLNTDQENGVFVGEDDWPQVAIGIKLTEVRACVTRSPEIEHEACLNGA